MTRRRNILAQSAPRQERERQEGVKSPEGFFVGNYPFAGDVSLEFNFYFSQAGEAGQTFPAIFGNYPGITVYNVIDKSINKSGTWQVVSYVNNVVKRVIFSLPDGWHHAVFVLRELVGTLYVDGTPVGTITYPIYPFTGSRFVLGTFFPTGAILPERNYKESINRCRVFNYALSPSEVAALYNNGRAEEYVVPSTKKEIVPISILSDNSYTWDENNTIWGHRVMISAHPEYGEIYRATVTVNNYEAGNPMVYVGSGNNGANLPAANGTYERYIWVTERNAEWAVRLYGGRAPEYRKVTVTLDKIERVGCIAEYLPQNIVTDPATGLVTAWLDSAKQLPANDEYLPPLLQSIGGYDLAANGTPEIIARPNLYQYWQMTEPMTMERLISLVWGTVTIPIIIDGALRITSSETANSYVGGAYYRNIIAASPGDSIEWSFEARATGAITNGHIGLSRNDALYYTMNVPLTTSFQRFSYKVENITQLITCFWVSKIYTDTSSGEIDVKNITIKVYRK